MARQLKREILYLSLPVILLAGCALWMSDASKFVRGAVTPEMTVGEILLMERGPIFARSGWLDRDAGVMLPLSFHYPTQSVRKDDVSLLQMPHTTKITQMSLSNSSGQALPRQPVMFTQPYFDQTGAAEMGVFFDLDRVPPALGQITLSALITPTKGPAKPLKIVVRPAWFTRAPKNLRLQKVSWTPSKNRGEGDVQIVLKYIGKQALGVDKAQSYGTNSIQWRVKLTPAGAPWREKYDVFNLLYNWSPRLESPDGKYSSLRATGAYKWGKYPAYFGAQSKSSSPFDGPDIAACLARYPLQLVTKDARRSGNIINITHHITGLNSHKGPLVFKTEIGVPGDGFLPVSYALPRSVSK